jgi:hypothetical protein
MEVMLGTSLYSYLYLKQKKRFVFLIIAYVFSSTKLENRFCLEARGVGGEREEAGGRGEKWTKQCMHM